MYYVSPDDLKNNFKISEKKGGGQNFMISGFRPNTIFYPEIYLFNHMSK